MTISETRQIKEEIKAIELNIDLNHEWFSDI